MQMDLMTVFKRQSMVAGVIAFLVGLVVLMSWAFGIGSIKNVFPSTDAMKANTAVCFLLSSTSLLIWREESRSRKVRYIAYVCAGLVVLIATLTLIEYVT